MSERTLQASTFEAQCLALLDEVASTRTTILVIKHGRPLARLIPVDDQDSTTVGSVTLLADDDEAFFKTGETWHAGGAACGAAGDPPIGLVAR